MAIPSAGDFIEHRTFGPKQLDLERHLADRMRRAAQARVIGANNRLHSIEHSMRQPFAMDISLSHLQHASIHREIILPRGDDEIAPTN